MAEKKKKKVKSILIFILILLVLALAAPLTINAYLVSATEDYLITKEKAEQLGADCILVLGAGLKPDGSPNHMLQDRLDQGIALYKAGAAPKLLLSGDNGQVEYDEVNAMKEYALNAGVAIGDIFMDHAGF